MEIEYIETNSWDVEIYKSKLKKVILAFRNKNLFYSCMYFFFRSHAVFTIWVKVVYTDPSGHKHYR